MYFYTHIRTTYYIHYITISTHRSYIQYNLIVVQLLSFSVWKLIQVANETEDGRDLN